MHSIVSYPDRGTDGENSYRGNCSGRLIEDLINQFHVRQITDFMVGSGTTEDVAKRMGISSACFDLNRGFDLLNDILSMRSPSGPASFSGILPIGTSSNTQGLSILRKQ